VAQKNSGGVWGESLIGKRAGMSEDGVLSKWG